MTKIVRIDQDLQWLSNYNQPQPPKTKVNTYQIKKMERFWQNKGVVLPLLGGIIFYQLFASIPQSNTGKCFTLLDGWKCKKYWTAGFWPIWFRELVERVLLPRLVDLQYLTGQQCNGGLAQSFQHFHSEHLPFCICMYSTTGAFFAWRAPILSWPRIMCSQVRMLKFLEPSREMP